MLKRVVRKSIRRLRRWLAEEGANKPGRAPRQYSYPWLNEVLFPGVLKSGSGTFRPNYTWGVIQAANLANAIGTARLSVLEFGVAGGNGLLSLERIAEEVAAIYGLTIDVYGFDTGEGLPEPNDYRDLPNIFSSGRHAMNAEKLGEELQTAKLVLGLLDETIDKFIQSEPAPVGFMAIDLDYYSSTMHALRLLEADEHLLLPRIVCYFDDIMGLTYGDHVGERLAIADFNNTHAVRKLSPIYGLRYHIPPPHASQQWTEKFYMAHIFDHTQYGNFDNLAPIYDLSLRVDSQKRG